MPLALTLHASRHAQAQPQNIARTGLSEHGGTNDLGGLSLADATARRKESMQQRSASGSSSSSPGSTAPSTPCYGGTPPASPARSGFDPSGHRVYVGRTAVAACACGAIDGCCAALGAPGSSSACSASATPLLARVLRGSGPTLCRSDGLSAALSPLSRSSGASTGTCLFGLRSLQHHADYRFAASQRPASEGAHAVQLVTAAAAQGDAQEAPPPHGGGGSAAAAGTSQQQQQQAAGSTARIGGGAANLSAGLDMDQIGTLTLAEAMQVMIASRGAPKARAGAGTSAVSAHH